MALWEGMTPADFIDDLGHAIAERYRRIEETLEATLRRHLEQAIASPPGLTDRLAAVRDLRDQAERLLQSVPAGELAGIVARITAGEAATEVARQMLTIPTLGASTVTAGGLWAVAAAETELRDSLRALNARILRAPADAYQAMTATTIGDMLAGRSTWQQLQRRQVDRYVADGITGFIDKSGRRWRIGSYAEMATRTAAARAWRDQSVASMHEHGIETFSIVIGSDACANCAAWADKVLTERGALGDVVVPHAITAEPTVLRIDGTLEQARAAGWGHPNCRCVLVAALPGLDRRGVTTHDPEHEKARDKLRELEREVRDAKRGGDPDEIGEAQAQLRAHVRDTGITRRTFREQLPFADGGTENPRGRTKPTPPKSPWTDREHLSWEQRRRDLGIDFKGDDAVKDHEIRFLERFKLDLGHQVEWIPRAADRRPTNDFRWLGAGVEIELKHRAAKAVADGKVSEYLAFRRAMGSAALSASKHPLHPLAKDHFILNMEDRVLTPQLRAEFAAVNRDIVRLSLAYPLVKRVWVIHRDGFEEIVLL